MKINMLVFKFKTQFFHYLERLVSQGYRYWFSGKISTKEAHKVIALQAKFATQCSTDATENQRYRRRKKGLANSQLRAWYDEKNKQLIWILLATDGIHVYSEQLQDSQNKKTRITITGYELKQTPRKNSDPRWTWMMTADTYDYWHAEIQQAIRKHHDDRLKQIWYSLRRVAGFHGVREQVFKLQTYALSEWRRSRKGDYPYEKIYVGWVGSFNHAEIFTLEELVLSMNKNK